MVADNNEQEFDVDNLEDNAKAEANDEPVIDSPAPTALSEMTQDNEKAQNPLISTPSFSKPPASPRYPSLARKRGQQGTVWLEIWLNKFGEQTKRVITASSGVKMLDKAALETVSKWQFRPHTQADIRIASRVKIPIEFVLN